MIRGVWSRDTIGWVIAVALLPAFAVLLLEQGVPAAQRMVLALAVVLAWQALFRFSAGVPMSPTAAVTAVAVALLAPGEMATWQLVLAVTFGSVLGEAVFGGWGRNFLSPAVVALAFMFISFPEVSHPPAGPWIAAACAPAALLLLATGILSWRVLAAAVGSLVLTALALDADVASLTRLGGVAFGLVFLVGDPVAAPTTAAARVLYGALTGALTAYLGVRFGALGAPQAIVFAALLASIFAPLLDHAGVAAAVQRRRRRHG